MQLFHSSSVTGNTVACSDADLCRESVHFSQKEAADSFLKRRIESNLALTSSDSTPELDAILKKSVASGFVRGSSSDALGEAQLKILSSPKALVLLSEEFSKYCSDSSRESLARIIKYGLNRCRGKVFLPLSKQSIAYIEEVEEESSREVLLDAALKLWHKRDSPLHERAKALLLYEDLSISGYYPKDYSEVKKFNTADWCDRLSIDYSDLPVNAISYDLEVSTSEGLGLRPRRAQITEIVLAMKDETWVLSGDEKFILKEFSSILSSQSKNTVLVGWNNHCCDNIFLQTRAEFHELSEWRGVLYPTGNFGEFEPYSLNSEAQSLQWSTFNGSVLEDLDLFQERVKSNLATGVKNTVGLKSFVKSLGCSPIEVDRQNIHKLSPAMREAYVVSDGLCTLRAYREFQKQLW